MRGSRDEMNRAAWRLMLDTGLKVQAASEKAMRDLTMRQYQALEALAAMESGSLGTLKGIADRLGTTMQNTSQFISVLVAKGYIIHERDKEDRRHLNMSLTESGREALKREAVVREEFLRKAYAVLDDSELAELLTLLHKLHSFDGKKHPSFEG